MKLNTNPRTQKAGACWLAALCVVAWLGGCASSVKLDEPAPVREGTTTQVGGSSPIGVTATTALPPAQTASAPSRRVAAVDATPAPQSNQPPANVGRVVLFDYDSYVIKPEFQSVLDAHARYLKATNTRRVGLEGHTDERGGREYNLALGQRRAEAVARALRVLGVADAQMEAVSFGKEKPAAGGSDEAAWAKNRRVELFYK